MNPEQRVSEDDPDVRYTYIVGRISGLKKVYYSNVDGEARFEGDIVLGSTEQMERFKEAIEQPDTDVERACAISSPQALWPNGVIPFQIQSALPNQQRVTDAINHIHDNTTLRLVPRTSEPNFVTFRDGDGCSSAVGMRGGEQAVTMGRGCDWPRVVHEICHAFGLWHEQSREDRTQFVTINWNNIPEHRRHNFNQHVTDGDDVGPYDYGSLMHYGRRDFAIDPSVDTLTPTDPNAAIGQRTRLSGGDIAALERLYAGLYIVRRGALVAASVVDGDHHVLGGGEWTGSSCMAALDGMLYIVQGQYLVRANPADGSWAVMGDGDWTGSSCMAALGGMLYVVQGQYLVRANPADGSWAVMGDGDWTGSSCMAALNGTLYIVQGRYLVRVNPADGGWAVLGDGDWTGSSCMAALNGMLYIVQGQYLVRANPADGGWAVLGDGDWTGSTCMAAANQRLYVVQGRYLVEANPADGGWAVVGAEDWTGSICMTGTAIAAARRAPVRAEAPIGVAPNAIGGPPPIGTSVDYEC